MPFPVRWLLVENHMITQDVLGLAIVTDRVMLRSAYTLGGLDHMARSFIAALCDPDDAWPEERITAAATVFRQALDCDTGVSAER